MTATDVTKGTLAIPEADRRVVPPEVLDRAVADVAAHGPAWLATGVDERIALLDRMIADTAAVAEAWTEAACAAKGLVPGSAAAGEEWVSGVGLVLRNMRLLRESLDDIRRTGRPQFPGPVTTRPDGRVVVRVFPRTALDRVVFTGMTGEVWMQPGTGPDDVVATQARAYRDPGEPRVALVLAAGNIASLGPRDTLAKLFAANRVVVMKCNPVNDYLHPYWERAMSALVEAGVLRIVDGGAAEGAHLCSHPLVDEIHITGSDKTHDAIVFGAGDEGRRRKQRGERLVDKPVTSELGNVSPVVVVPGDWSPADIRYQAEHVATMLAHNAGFNCLTVRAIVTHRRWPQRAAFLAALRAALRSVPTRPAYYPGAHDRFRHFVGAHPEAQFAGDPPDGHLPWTVLPDVDPDASSPAFTTEAFCSLTAETALPGDSVTDFIDNAVRFCNERLWGTLSATMLVHPRSEKDPQVAAAVDRAIADLRYGSIGVNVWHAFSFAMTATSWGAYPGHEDTDIQSGRGVVANTYLFERPEKSVVRAPFRARPKPAWFATHRRSGEAQRLLAQFEATPSWAGVARMLVPALRP